MDYSDEVIEQIIDFDSNRRTVWEAERKPYSVLIELTPKCNMNCIHCYMRNVHEEEQLSTENVFYILDILYKKGILFVTFTGGEILTRKDFVDIYLYAKKKGFFVELFSNGYLFDDRIIDIFVEYPPLLVDISLYGACEKTYKRITGVDGAFQKVLNNCQKLVSAGVRIALKSPILNESFNEIEDMKKIADNLRVVFRPIFEIIPTLDGDSSTKNEQIPIKSILEYEFNAGNVREKTVIKNKKSTVFDCKIGVSGFVIDYKGKMCPCMRMRHHGVTLTYENYDEIWESFGSYKEIVLPDNHRCFKCNAYEYCEVCPAERERIYGDLLFRCEDDCKYAYARSDYYTGNASKERILERF